MNPQNAGRSDGDTMLNISSAPKALRELKVEDALLYLDQVKVEFSGKPQIYNEFLEIMKNFKSQEINTPGVIQRVRNLFRGYNKLILGFNTFLPDGYKIELTAEELSMESFETVIPAAVPASSANSSSGQLTSSGSTQPPQSTGLVPPPVLGLSSSSSGAFQAPATAPAVVAAAAAAAAASNINVNVNAVGSQALVGNLNNVAVSGVTIQPAAAAPASNPAVALATPAGTAPVKQPPQQMQQQHAIAYVTAIRNRFANEPDTYRQFLRILHTYQKEQKGIKDVLEQVSLLFADHPDLLMEFTYFLPDSVQDQAKERLARAAKESEMRRMRANAAAAAAVSGIDHSHTANDSSMTAAPGKKRDRSSAGGNSSVAVQSNDPNGDFNEDGQQAKTTKPRSKGIKRKPSEGAGGLPGNTATSEVKQDGSSGQNMMWHDNSNSGMPDSHKQYHDSIIQQQQHTVAPVIASNGNASHAGQAASSSSLSAGFGQPVISSHNISVSDERKFFDRVKEYFINNNIRDCWLEFVKCLDMFSCDVLSKKEMFSLVQDLLDTDKVGEELNIEFRKLVIARSDYDANPQDLWFATPLSEIDFTQCRKCTPSYRALPKDYPKPICSDRNETEADALNDMWVSIPIGSEETFSFKHMRKNQFEEALFKCEDDRFEIDMIIDTNASAIRILEPIAEEISTFKQVEESTNPDGSVVPKFSLQLEKRNLSAIHINAITRIYGEHASEILELLRKNPAGSIPVILKRLKQKDLEWRKARQELGKVWKDVIDKNYQRSFDHRSFYFRQQDRRCYSIKHLVADIKGTIVESGTSLQEMSIPGVALSMPAGKESLLGTSLLKPELVMSYSFNDHTIHKDIYNILCHAAEYASMTIYDREKLTALWRDWLRIYFNIPVHYLYPSCNVLAFSSTPITGPAAAAAVGAVGAAAAVDVSADLSQSLPTAAPISTMDLTAKHFVSLQDNVPVDITESWPVNTRVITSYGPGKVLDFRSADSMYTIQLDFGKAYMKPLAVIGAEELSPQALLAIGVTKDPASGADVVYEKLLVAQSHSNDASSDGTGASIGTDDLVEGPSNLFFGTQQCYAFLRIHHTLYTRLAAARAMCFDITRTEKKPHPLLAVVKDSLIDETQELLQPVVLPDELVAESTNQPEEVIETIQPKTRPLYNAFLSLLLSLTDGTMDVVRYEEAIRQLLGHRAYVLYTLDKVIQQALRSLQLLSNDDNFQRLVGIYVYHRATAAAHIDSASSAVKVNGSLYQAHVAKAMMYSSEEIYRLQILDTSDHKSGDEVYVACQCLGLIQGTAAVTGMKGSADPSRGDGVGDGALSQNDLGGGIMDGISGSGQHGDSLLDHTMGSMESSDSDGDDDGGMQDDMELMDESAIYGTNDESFQDGNTSDRGSSASQETDNRGGLAMDVADD